MAGYECTVTLYRDSLYTPWGFRLQGGADYGRPLSVQRVQACSAAEGILLPGDQIVAIEGCDARRLTHELATEVVMQSGGTLRLTVVRAPSRSLSQPPHAVGAPQSRFAHFRQQHQPPQEHKPRSQLWESVVQATHGQVENEVNTQSTPAKATSHDEKVPIPKNSALAAMMTASINQPREPKKTGLSGIDLLLRNPRPCDNLADFLPRPPSRSSRATTPQPQMSASSIYYPSSSLPSPYRRSSLGGRMSMPREMQMRNDLTDSISRASEQQQQRRRHSLSDGGEDMSGRSTPQSVAIEFGSPEKPTAVGVWTPPAQHPSARLVHAQYNSPFSLYTPHNVADMIQKQTGTKLHWQKKPPVRFLDDISDSPTYQVIHAEEEGAEQSPVHGRIKPSAGPPPQSFSFRRIRNALHAEVDEEVYKRNHKRQN